MYLNVYVPGLQYEHGINRFLCYHRGQPVPSAALMSLMTRSFVAALEDFAARHEIPLVQFEKGQRKDAVMAEHLRCFASAEGVVFIGKAQENTPVFRTERRRNPKTGRTYLWIDRQAPARWLAQLTYIRPAISQLDAAYSLAQVLGASNADPAACCSS